MALRVYSFGCKDPVLGNDKAMEQLRLANRAWNDFARQKRLNQEAWRERRDNLCPELTMLESEVSATKEEIKRLDAAITQYKVNNKTRKSPAELANQKKELKQVNKNRYTRMKELRLETKELFKKELDVVNAEGKAVLKALKRDYQTEHKLYCKTKNDVAESVSKAKNLKFRPFRGSGKLAIQDSEHICPTFQDLLDGKWKDIQLDLKPWKKGFRGFVSMCIGRFGNPTFVTLPINIHRKIPEQAIVKRVWLVRKLVGGTHKWFCQFVLNDNGSGCFKKDTGSSGCVSIDLGYREDGDDKLAVVSWVGSDGHGATEYLPAHFKTGFDEAEKKLSEIRANNFNDIIKFIREYTENAPLLPIWFQEEISHIHLWKSPRRIHHLMRIWQRYDGDEFVYNRIEEYRKQDRHNYLHQEGLRSKLIRRRTHWYKCLAAYLRTRYARVLMDGINLASLQRTTEDDNKHAKRNKNIACPSTLKKWLEGEKTDHAYTTRTCCFCGHINPKKSGEFLTCESCNKSYNRDINACIVMLSRAGVKPKMTEPLAALIRQEVRSTETPISDIVFPEKRGPLANLLLKCEQETTYDNEGAEPV